MTFVRNNELVSADLDGDTVMMGVESGNYFGLSGVGSRIWELLEAPHPVGEILEDLIARYDVSLDVLRPDVEAFLEDMQKHGLVKKV